MLWVENNSGANALSSMDSELKQYLDARDAELKQYLDARFGAVDAQFRSTFELITNVKESLEREIKTVVDRLDIQSTRLDRQASFVQTGSRWSSRMNVWADRIDVEMEKSNQEIAELRRRIERIEGSAN